MKAGSVSLLCISLLISLVLCACQNSAVPSERPIATSSPSIEPNLPPTLIPSATITPTPGIGSTWIRPADGMTMLYVPYGEFNMGSSADVGWEICKQYAPDCERDNFLDEEPVHVVVLDGFWIDRTEVTNAMYALCVDTAACQLPTPIQKLPPLHYGEAGYEDYPVGGIDHANAQAYCTWAGVRLPSEAEWEKAARGTDDRVYPWGDTPPDCSLLNSSPNFTACVGDVSPVGSYPAGASPYGALDMAGNVYEYVSDWYALDYYTLSPRDNPAGPEVGEWRIVRGGAWNLNDPGVRLTDRQIIHPLGFSATLGFRCAMGGMP